MNEVRFKTWQRVQEEEEEAGRHVRFMIFDTRFNGYRDADENDLRNNPTIRIDNIYRSDKKTICFLWVKNQINYNTIMKIILQ